MSRALVASLAVLALLAALLSWRLLEAHEALGQANLKARLNADAVTLLQQQDLRNQAIDRRLEQLAAVHDATTRETVREIYVQPSSDACRRSPAMRALDGRLRAQPGPDDGRAAAATAPAGPVPPSGGPAR
jgi:hypothetical protein